MSIRLRAALTGLLIAAAPLAATAQTAPASSIALTQPWARATPPGAKVGAGYLVIENRGAAPDRLLAARTPVANVVEIHEMAMEGGTMRMRALGNGLPVAAGGRAELKPGGYHIMFIDLKQPLKAGDSIAGELVFEKAGTLPVKFMVMPIGATPGAGHQHH
jgi:copper(I)-binding protein